MNDGERLVNLVRWHFNEYIRALLFAASVKYWHEAKKYPNSSVPGDYWMEAIKQVLVPMLTSVDLPPHLAPELANLIEENKLSSENIPKEKAWQIALQFTMQWMTANAVRLSLIKKSIDEDDPQYVERFIEWFDAEVKIVTTEIHTIDAAL